VLAGSTLPPASPHRTAVERVTAPARARAAHGDHTVSVRPVSAHRGPPGRGPAGFLAGRVWQAAGPSAASRGLDFGPTLYDNFKSFFNCLNSRNCFKLQEFVETCRDVQKLENKFFMNPLEPLFTVGLIKLSVME
jgi:hypothetical protein